MVKHTGVGTVDCRGSNSDLYMVAGNMMMVIMTLTQLHSATAVAKACPPPTSRVTTHTAVDEIRLKVVHAVGLYFMSSCMGTACMEANLLGLECWHAVTELIGKWFLGGHCRAPEATHPDFQAMR